VIMTLPDGRSFRMLPPEEITLADLIMSQKQTGVGPIQLQARLASNLAKWARLVPYMQALQDAAGDADKASAAAFAFESAVADAEPDMLAEGVHIWLSRRAAGEPDLTLEQACDFPFMGLRRELEPDEQAQVDEEKAEEERAAADPTTPASVNGKPPGGPNRAARRSSARKSTSPST